MTTTMELILAPALRTRGYTEKLLVGIGADQAARKPRVGGAIIDTNHPAFIMGHLGLYLARLMTITGQDPAPVAAPAEWEALFKAGAECCDDPEGAVYPAFGALTSHYFSATERAIATLRTLPDSILLQPTPDEKARQNFPFVGVLVNFLLNNHVMMHMGQISVWRRCMGMPSAM
ncbi:MAG: DinB family protein [Phycisphaerae bacterium]|nr:DinB family protein [Phycisphaerae bacterium]